MCWRSTSIIIVIIPDWERNGVVQDQSPDESQDQLQSVIHDIRTVCKHAHTVPVQISVMRRARRELVQTIECAFNNTSVSILKLDGVGVFATAPCVSYHADDRAQHAGGRTELCTPSEATPPPLPKSFRRNSCARRLVISLVYSAIKTG